MKLFKYSTLDAIKYCAYGIFSFTVGFMILIDVLPSIKSNFDKIESPIIIIMSIIFVAIGIMTFFKSGLSKFGKKIGVGDEGILLPKGELVLWYRIKKVAPLDENFRLIWETIFPWQKNKNGSKSVSKNKYLQFSTSKRKSIAIEYIDESGDKKHIAVSDDDIKNYSDFEKLVYKGFKKHKEDTSS